MQFCSIAPTTKSDGTVLTSGDVYIETGIISAAAFDIVKGVKVYPVTAFQFSSGEWSRVEAKATKMAHGKPGQPSSLKAGQGLLIPCNTGTAPNGTVSVTDELVTFGFNGGGEGGESFIGTNYKIDLTPYTILSADMAVTENPASTNRYTREKWQSMIVPSKKTYTRHQPTVLALNSKLSAMAPYYANTEYSACPYQPAEAIMMRDDLFFRSYTCQ